MVMKNRIQTAPVIKRERNGRRMSPFSWRRTPRLTFVSCQPILRRSRNPSFRGAGEYGEDGTVGVGVHMESPMPPQPLNPAKEFRSKTDETGSLVRSGDVVRR